MKVLLASRGGDHELIYNFLKKTVGDVIYTQDRFDLLWLEEQGVDFIVSHCYGPIIKPLVVHRYWHRIVNVHVSYLPYGKGIYPNVWSFFENTPNGVSLHYIDEGIDTGDVIVRRAAVFDEGQTLATSHKILVNSVRNLFCEYTEAILRGNCIATPQKKFGEEESYHSKSTSQMLMELFPLKWNTPVGEVEKMGRYFRESGMSLEEFVRSRSCAGTSL